MKRDDYNIFKEYKAKTRQLLSESDDKSDVEEGYVPYTQDDEMLTSIKETAKTQFGADFTDYPHPLQYNTNDGDVIFSCAISDLNNAKVQFRFKDPSGQGCYLWIDSLRLTEENLDKLRVVFGVYKNWKQNLLKAEDLKPMTLKNGSDSGAQNKPPAPANESVRRVRPGDDY